ncbi:hypothetical protein AQ914_29440 [Burkholderia pseudomallei]|nr:hypothetical protein AQ914_29440 [Burkholderia pseudomallei]
MNHGVSSLWHPKHTGTYRTHPAQERDTTVGKGFEMKAFLRVVWHPLRYLLRFARFRRFAPVWLVATLLLWAGTVELLNRVGWIGAVTVLNDLIVVRVVIALVEALVGATFRRSSTSAVAASFDDVSFAPKAPSVPMYVTAHGVTPTPVGDEWTTATKLIS